MNYLQPWLRQEKPIFSYGSAKKTIFISWRSQKLIDFVYIKVQLNNKMMALAAPHEVSNSNEFETALTNKAIKEILIKKDFNCFGSYEINNPVTIDGNNLKLKWCSIIILSDDVTIKNLNIIANPKGIRVGRYDRAPKNILIENCLLCGNWEGKMNPKFKTWPEPYAIGINMLENTKVTVKDTTITKCGVGIIVHDNAVCTLQNVYFEENYKDKNRSGQSLMYGGISEPTGIFINDAKTTSDPNTTSKYKQFVNEEF
jgi:hypothetical protein